MDLSGVWAKIERAKKHVGDLDADITTLNNGNFYRHARQESDDGTHMEWRVVFTPGFQLPDSLSLMCGDAVHNLRSALDHFACGAVPNCTTDTAFPVWRKPSVPTANDLKALVGGKIKGAPQDLIKAVQSLQSYKGGNHDFVWKLDQLDIIDKHRTVLVVVSSYETANIDFGAMMRSRFRSHFPDAAEIPSMVLGIRPKHRCPANDGDVLFRVPIAEAEHYENVNFSFAVAFGEPGVAECEPVVPTLTQLVEATTDLLKNLASVAP
jgi:hypothetical protein